MTRSSEAPVCRKVLPLFGFLHTWNPLPYPSPTHPCSASSGMTRGHSSGRHSDPSLGALPGSNLRHQKSHSDCEGS